MLGMHSLTFAYKTPRYRTGVLMCRRRETQQQQHALVCALGRHPSSVLPANPRPVQSLLQVYAACLYQSVSLMNKQVGTVLYERTHVDLIFSCFASRTTPCRTHIFLLC